MPRLLIVDDEKNHQELAEYFIGCIGIETDAVDHPNEVTAEIVSGIDAILMDTQLGEGCRGYDYCQPFKETYKIPVIGMSSSSLYRSNWENVGADGFIEKLDLSDKETLKRTILPLIRKYDSN